MSSPGMFLVLRRMRAPLIALTSSDEHVVPRHVPGAATDASAAHCAHVIFAVSVPGMSLIPGQDDTGRPDRITLFESFHLHELHRHTIGFGELPHEFTPA